MSADYSDGFAWNSPREQLSTLLLGDDVTPPPPDVGLALLDAARTERVQYLVTWRIVASSNLDSWFGPGAPRAIEEMKAQIVTEEVHRRELANVLAQLSAVPGALPVVFKGTALASSHYPEPWLRPRVDTDILVSSSTVSACLDALRRAGYREEIATSGALVTSQASLDRTDQFGFNHVIDLHWQIANRTVIARVLSHAEIASRAVPAPAIGAEARIPNDVDALVIACLHRAAHHRDSENLLWLYDIHLLAEGLSRDGWDAFVTIAERGEVMALCARGLALAAARLQTTIPPDVMARLTGARREPSAIYLSKSVRLVDWLMADVRGLPWHLRGRLLFEHVAPPVAYMREKYGVQSRRALVLAYVKRALTGMPKWFVRGSER